MTPSLLNACRARIFEHNQESFTPHTSCRSWQLCPVSSGWSSRSTGAASGSYVNRDSHCRGLPEGVVSLQAGRTFRVFVSSTFEDLRAERNKLHEAVFPRLRDLCQKHGARFQAIDLRWGVSEEASLDQQTMNICLGEIERCRHVTPRPNFVVLLGQRYGWCPPPPQPLPGPAADRGHVCRRSSPEPPH